MILRTRERLKVETTAMKHIHIFLLTVLVEVAFGGEFGCLFKEMIACRHHLDFPKLVGRTDHCETLHKVVGCLSSSSKKCNGDSQEAIENFSENAREVCNEDSQMSQDFQRYRSCLQEYQFFPNFIKSCVKEHVDAVSLSDLENHHGSTDEMMMALICPLREKLEHCKYSQIKARCGKSAENFFRKFQEPYDEIIMGDCNSGYIPSISMALTFLQLLITIFSFRNIL